MAHSGFFLDISTLARTLEAEVRERSDGCSKWLRESMDDHRGVFLAEEEVEWMRLAARADTE